MSIMTLNSSNGNDWWKQYKDPNAFVSGTTYKGDPVDYRFVAPADKTGWQQVAYASKKFSPNWKELWPTGYDPFAGWVDNDEGSPMPDPTIWVRAGTPKTAAAPAPTTTQTLSGIVNNALNTNNALPSSPGTTTAGDPNRPSGGYAYNVATYDPTKNGGLANASTYNASTYNAAQAAAQGYTAAQYQAERAKAQGYSAEDWQAYWRQVQADELSRNQLNKMLDENGQYIQRARHRGNEQAQARGLLNSSLSAGASQAAAIDAAQPFALQDAGTFAKQALANQEYVNRQRSENAAAENQARAFTADAANKASLTNAELTTRARGDNAAAINQASQFTAESKNKASLANAEMTNKARSENAAALNRAGEFNAAAKNTASLANADARNKAAQFNATARNDANMQLLKGDQAETLAKIEANNKVEIQRVASAGDLYKQITNNITTINTTKDISAAQQSAATGQQFELLDAGLKIVKGIQGVSIPTI